MILINSLDFNYVIYFFLVRGSTNALDYLSVKSVASRLTKRKIFEFIR